MPADAAGDSEAAMFHWFAFHWFAFLAAAPIMAAHCAAAHAAAPERTLLAQDLPDCLTIIALLRSATGETAIYEPDGVGMQSGLVGRLDAAARAFTEGRAADAAWALIDYQGRLQRLRTTGQIESDDAESLIEGAKESAACVLDGNA